jgi:hypothetical protein
MIQIKGHPSHVIDDKPNLHIFVKNLQSAKYFCKTFHICKFLARL